MSHTATRSLLASFLLACAATGQTITWGPVMPSVGPSDVSIAGSLVFAGNSHGPGAPIPATVNGVTFSGGFQPLDWNGYIQSGLNGSTTGDLEYDKLLNGSRAMQNASAPPDSNPTPWGGIRLDTLGAFNPGYTYQIQVWFTDQRTGTPTNVLYDRVMTLSSAWGTATIVGGEITNIGTMLQGPVSGPLDADPDNAPATTSPDTVFGQHCTGTFVYVPGGELWLAIQGSHPIPTNVLQPHITALQIRDLSSAYHQPYGTGCHSYVGPPSPTADLVEEFIGTPAAKAALDGNAMLFVHSGNGYVAQWLPGAAGTLYVPPSGGATVVADADDTTETILPSVPVPVPNGTADTWTVSSNGVLTASSVGNAGNNWQASLAQVGTATGLGWFCWRDYSPNAAGSGKVKAEEVGGVLYVTFDGVYEFNSSSPATFQWQVDLASGNVTMVWVSMAATTNTTTMVVGSTLAGAGPTPASTPLSSANPFVMTGPLTLSPMSLSASPPPVVNPSTLVTYTAGNLPEFVPGSGVYLSTLFLSTVPLPGGFDLNGILTTVPGCKAWIGTLAVDLGAQLSASPTANWMLNYSNAFFTPGDVILAQAVALFDPAFPLANGESGGFLVSNGVLSTVQLQ